MSTNINTQEQQYKKPGAGAIIGGVLAGSTIDSLVCAPHKSLTPQDLLIKALALLKLLLKMPMK